jgi:uncharacterized membrane protein YeaQ/YmgE (transglycosylase-associated protein family)
VGHIIAFLIVGLVAGWLAGEIMKSRRSLLGNLGIGVAGALIGGFLGRIIGLAATGLIGGIIMATIGAVVLLYVLEKLGK